MPNLAQHESQNPEVGRFTASIISVLRPLIRLMVGHITFPAFLSITQTIYVEETERKLKHQDPGARITKSALSLMSGIDTRAISQILNASSEEKEIQTQDLLPEAHVLEKWARDPAYQSEDDQINDLQIYGRGITFQNLVSQTVGRNVTAQTVLDLRGFSGNRLL